MLFRSDVTIGGGAGYGTGTQGNVIIAAVRGAVGVGVIAPAEKLSVVDGGNVSLGNLASGTATNTVVMKHGTPPLTSPANVTQITGTALGLSVRNVGDVLNILGSHTAPASATDTGSIGEIRFTSTYVYYCTATNTWVRAALATW